MSETDMILTLKNEDFQNIVVVKLGTDSNADQQYVNLTSTINVSGYSRALCEVDPMRRPEFILAFTRISELHLWLGEMRRHGNLPVSDSVVDRYEDVLRIIRKKLKQAAEDFNLLYEERS